LARVGLATCIAAGGDGINGVWVARDFSWDFVDGQLARIQYTFPYYDYGGMLQALTNKYGQPTSTNITTMENGFGATFSSMHATWSNSVSEITMDERFFANLNRADVTVMNKLLNAEYFKRYAAANGPKI
jgi:hypothetical protein